jgi:enoyl-CoA hydratase
MALACDLRIAVPGASFFYPVIKLGYLPQPSDPRRLASLVGPAQAKLILLAGQKLTADEALNVGLIDKVVRDHPVLDHAWGLCAAVAAADPDVAQKIKAMCPSG